VGWPLIDFGLKWDGKKNALWPAMSIRTFHDLVVWQRAMELAERIYEITRAFPVTERYSMTLQLRRAAVSVASNIAEGHARPTGVYINHLRTASGSTAEMRTQLELAYRLKLVPKDRVVPLLDSASQLSRMLHGLIASVAASRDTAV
jgi:four helix bundle protein